MRYKIAKFLAYLWPVLSIGYIIAFTLKYVEWLEHIEVVQDKWQMVAAMPVFFAGIVALFVIHHYYGKLVLWIKG